MNQSANAGAASLERCKRMAQSPLLAPLQSPSFFLLLSWSPSLFVSDSLFFSPALPFSLSNCYLSLIFTITTMFTFHFSLTHLFSSLTLLLDHPSPVLLSYLFISFFVHFTLWSSIVLHSLVPSFLFSASLLLQFFPWAPPSSLSPLIVFKEGKEKRKEKNCVEKRKC